MEKCMVLGMDLEGFERQLLIIFKLLIFIFHDPPPLITPMTPFSLSLSLPLLLFPFLSSCEIYFSLLLTIFSLLLFNFISKIFFLFSHSLTLSLSLYYYFLFFLSSCEIIFHYYWLLFPCYLTSFPKYFSLFFVFYVKFIFHCYYYFFPLLFNLFSKIFFSKHNKV